MDAICIGGEEGCIGCARNTSGVRNDCDPVKCVVLPSVVLGCKDIALINVRVGHLEVHTLQERSASFSQISE